MSRRGVDLTLAFSDYLGGGGGPSARVGLGSGVSSASCRWGRGRGRGRGARPGICVAGLGPWAQVCKGSRQTCFEPPFVICIWTGLEK